ncbi:UDP-N-acetylmuramate--L-alanine ligase [Niabella drilacis]|uniref:UDP-N-acetylmuramate--alanine ligase n=1 Tax=Niabella drilacis (strain DSM 25811 / CCM 8410 / CCUG 62505 / LMG 26954 / E90) TaxID=1285928 RepID=A0A1G6VH71_NIADE|nr:Mur ligase domain-containing protein [Niabella drilacis]SDD53030.1 UDP-N-acetylmuramate--alanine ligase [Niabella drilacis]
MNIDLQKIRSPFFIGIAGAGMSAIAQYLQGTGKQVSGSDRFFNEGKAGDIKEKLEAGGIRCFLQNGAGITPDTDLVVASTAIEDTVEEIRKARALNIPVMHRSELLALIAASKKTIAIGGTSGKSTTTGMLFDILQQAGMHPSVISGAGLVSLIKKGKIGNAFVGSGEWLVIEADESDGSIVQYRPEIGVLLNIEKDHKELEELMRVFETFRNNSRLFCVNRSNMHSAALSANPAHDFCVDETCTGVGFQATEFVQDGFHIAFKVNGEPFGIRILGQHNMENAVAATAAAVIAGASLKDAAAALAGYEGIYRRSQVLGEKNGIWVVDDFAHNPVKCAAAIRSCQPVSDKVVAWFQPHGYTPTKFLRKEFVEEIGNALRPQDEIWMSEIFYAGGTTTKDISASDLISDLKTRGKNAYFVEDREQLLAAMDGHLQPGSTLLLMGARDPSLEQFAREIYHGL